MHPQYQQAASLSEKVIGAAIEVHRELGPGLVESIYEWALTKELDLVGLQHRKQQVVQVRYKGYLREEPLRYDLLIESCILVELKVVETILPKHKAQLLSYMKLLDVPAGFLFNFHEAKLVDGLHRMILPGANLP